ncbi:MAG: lysophospholipase [Ruminococcaceae bacterium]|nr:lysophospholipase [Oscillospiraceae bacterium]
MKKILFQGDSITDAGRNREYLYGTDVGYVHLVTSKLLFDYPGEFECFNRGISGNRIVDLYARIKIDIINLKPDILTILIGVNDVWHEVKRQNGVDNQKYKKIYSMLIEEIKEALPDTKIFILEPFVLCGSATEENYDTFRLEVEKRAQSAKEIAAKFNLPFISLQDKFDMALTKLNDVSYWLKDGVHPHIAGQKLIANEVLKSFKENKIVE